MTDRRFVPRTWTVRARGGTSGVNFLIGDLRSSKFFFSSLSSSYFLCILSKTGPGVAVVVVALDGSSVFVNNNVLVLFPRFVLSSLLDPLLFCCGVQCCLILEFVLSLIVASAYR